MQDLTSFEGRAGHERDRRGDVAGLDADHVGILVVAKVRDLLGLVHPGVPDHRIREVVLLNPHLSTGNHIGDDVFRRCIGVDPVCPLANHDNVPAFLGEPEVNVNDIDNVYGPSGSPRVCPRVKALPGKNWAAPWSCQ